MKNTTVRLVVILGIFAIAGIVVVQTYWMLRAWDLKEKQLDQSIQIALQNTAQKLAARKKVTLPDNTVKQVSSDYYFVNINDEIDANWLEYYLRTEFMQLQIGLDFEYAIYDCNTDKMMYGNYIKAESNTEKIICAIVFGSDQGLVGKFNDLLKDFVLKSFDELNGIKNVWAIGERVKYLLSDIGYAPTNLFSVPNSVNAITPLVGEILLKSKEAYERGDIDEVYIFYN